MCTHVIDKLLKPVPTISQVHVCTTMYILRVELFGVPASPGS